MAKDESKKEKKEKKRKHSEVEGAEVEVVAERKKDKKEKKRKSTDVDGDVAMDGAEVAVVKDEEDEEDEKKVVVKEEVPLAALVPFANPLCDEKAQKKVLKSVKKGKTPHTHVLHHCVV